MAERRSLIDGIRTKPTEQELAFIKGTLTSPSQAGEALPKSSAVSSTPARSPFSNRMRTDFVVALKRASLERQLNGIEPNTLQDILEAAIEPWLKSHGYL